MFCLRKNDGAIDEPIPAPAASVGFASKWAAVKLAISGDLKASDRTLQNRLAEQTKELERLENEAKNLNARIKQLENNLREKNESAGADHWTRLIKSVCQTFFFHPTLTEKYRRLISYHLSNALADSDLLQSLSLQSELVSVTLPQSADQAPTLELLDVYPSSGVDCCSLWRFRLDRDAFRCHILFNGKKAGVKFKANMTASVAIEGLLLVAFYPPGSQLHSTLQLPTSTQVSTGIRSVTFDPNRVLRVGPQLTGKANPSLQATVIEKPKQSISLESKISFGHLKIPFKDKIKTIIEKVLGKVLNQHLVAPASVALDLGILDFLDAAPEAPPVPESSTANMSAADRTLTQIQKALGSPPKWEANSGLLQLLKVSKDRLGSVSAASGLGTSQANKVATAAIIAAHIMFTMPQQNMDWSALAMEASQYVSSTIPDPERASAVSSAAKALVFGSMEDSHTPPSISPKPKDTDNNSLALSPCGIQNDRPQSPSPPPAESPSFANSSMQLPTSPSGPPAGPATTPVDGSAQSKWMADSGLSTELSPDEDQPGGSNADGDQLLTSSDSKPLGDFKNKMMKKYDTLKSDNSNPNMVKLLKKIDSVQIGTKSDKPAKSKADEVLTDVKNVLTGPLGKWSQVSNKNKGALSTKICKAFEITPEHTVPIVKATGLSDPEKAAACATAAFVVGYIQLSAPTLNRNWDELQRLGMDRIKHEIVSCDVESGLYAAAKQNLIDNGIVQFASMEG